MLNAHPDRSPAWVPRLQMPRNPPRELAVAFAGCLALGAAAALPAAEGRIHGDWNAIQHYCVECHNTNDWAGGVAFDSMSAEQIPADAKIWEDAISKLRGGFMPPPNAKQHPDRQQVTELIAWLEGTLDGHASANSGRIPLRRLNRREY